MPSGIPYIDPSACDLSFLPQYAENANFTVERWGYKKIWGDDAFYQRKDAKLSESEFALEALSTSCGCATRIWCDHVGFCVMYGEAGERSERCYANCKKFTIKIGREV
jgi:hypothetical protein